MNAVFIGGILGTIALWLLIGMSSSYPYDAAWTFGVLFGYSLIFALFLAVILLIHAVATQNVAFLKWPFVLFVLAYLVVVSASEFVIVRLTGQDTFALRVTNASGQLIEQVDVFGRGNYVRIDSLGAADSVVRPYRGREGSRIRDQYANRLSVSWYAGGRWRERVIVYDGVVLGEHLVIVFPTPDSIIVGQRRMAGFPH